MTSSPRLQDYSTQKEKIRQFERYTKQGKNQGANLERINKEKRENAMIIRLEFKKRTGTRTMIKYVMR